MAVIHVITPEYSPQIGGVADYTRQIGLGLADAGEEVHVWCPETSGDERNGRLIVHNTLGRMSRTDLERITIDLDHYPVPRRLLVQWVPHGYGFRSMNLLFCVWLWQRAARGDRVELMVHEPYLALWEGSWRQTAAALVHRVMTMILLRAASRVWMSIPSWEAMWKPYALGRRIPFVWLPVPDALQQPDAREVCAIRARLGVGRRPVVGHVGTFGPLVVSQLDNVLPAVLRAEPTACVLLIGAAGAGYAASFSIRHPAFADRIIASTALDTRGVAAHVAACDVLIQPYPDGVSSRRTTTMAGLHLGVPVVTTRGYLTEPFWDDAGLVRLSPVGEWSAIAGHVSDLLRDPDERRRLSERARQFYDQTFDVRHTIAALREPS